MNAVIDMTIREIFVGNMVRRRKELGVTQSSLAKTLGISQPSVASIESGDHVPSLETIEKIAAALNTSVVAMLSPMAELSRL